MASAHVEATRHMKDFLVFLLLLGTKVASRLFFRFRVEWVGTVPERPWSGLRLVAILNHTSLYEPLLTGAAGLPLLWDISHRGVVPVARKTLRRNNIGLFFKLLARHVVEVTRLPDHTWRTLLEHIDERALVTILPEGRMKRRNGLDSDGRQMTVRGGIADILRTIPGGRMLLVYSGGLHHIQAPGELLPRPFRTIRLRVESLDIAAYRESIQEDAGDIGFKRAVIADLEHRRDILCPTTPITDSPDAPSQQSEAASG